MGEGKLSDALLIGALGALATGIAIGIQSSLTARVGAIVGDVRTGLMTNLLGGTIAGLIILAILLFRGLDFVRVPSTALIMMAIAGALGVSIIMGVSFSLQRVGVAAGLATIILGQILVSTIVDTRGLGGVEPIPLTASRIAGILFLGVAVYLIVPKS